jgi:hypothetical protein
VERCVDVGSVDGCDLNQDVIAGSFRVLHEDVEVAIVGKNAGISELELGIAAISATILIDQLIVRECTLWILVQELHVRVRRRAVEIEVRLLDVLSVIAFFAGEAE